VLKNFKKADHIDCKILTFKVKKRDFFAPCKTRSIDFESSWIKIFALRKVEIFDTTLENWIENP
jgi:hypothetical protein